jgi:hypothetical protein
LGGLKNQSGEPFSGTVFWFLQAARGPNLKNGEFKGLDLDGDLASFYKLFPRSLIAPSRGFLYIVTNLKRLS